MPARGGTPELPDFSDPRSWRNSVFPVCVVQAMPQESAVATSIGASAVFDNSVCRRHSQESPCPGTSEEARSWVTLDRAKAIHVLYGHYLFPNLSICRFRPHARGDYAVDILHDVDAHADVPGDAGLDFFVPHVRASVAAARRLLDFYVGTLGVDEGFITTSISRMGCRLTVDWRAFGPRRLHEVLTVARWVEGRVFQSGKLKVIASGAGVTDLVVDMSPYERPDLPSKAPDESNAFCGPWLRPIGAVHHKSRHGAWWYRLTPVPHDRFRPSEAEWLASVSRGRSRDRRTWADPVLLDASTLMRWLEARHPKADALVEDKLRPAHELMELFERDGIIEQVPEEHRVTVRRAWLRATGAPSGSHARAELTPGQIAGLVSRIPGKKRERSDKWTMDCPRPSCGKKQKAAVFKASGVFHCFHCTRERGLPLWDLATELGFGHLLPRRRQSSEPLQRMLIKDAPASDSMDDWGPHVEVIDRTFGTPQAAWADRRRMQQEFLGRKDVRVLVDASDTGTGKTLTTIQSLRSLTSPWRVLVAREESKATYLEGLPGSIGIRGRRLGENCHNPALPEVMSRREPVARTLCHDCPHSDGCAYLDQFEQVQAGTNLVLLHGHGPFVDLDRFDNGSGLDVIDEDALDAVIQNDDFDAVELDLLRARVQLEEGSYDPEWLDPDRRPRRTRDAATPTLRVLIDRLQALLTTDAVTMFDVDLARRGHVEDLPLARYLFADSSLRDAVSRLDEDDLSGYDAARIELASMVDEPDKPIGQDVPPDVLSTWAPDGGDEWEEASAWAAWVKERLRPVHLPDELVDPAPRRPKDMMGSLVDGLRDLLRAAETGQPLTSSIMIHRPAKSGPWILRLTTRRPLLLTRPKVMHLSATVTPERTRLMHGLPSEEAKWIVYRARLPKVERRVVIGGAIFGKTSLLTAQGATERRERLFETAVRLMASELG